MLVDEYAMVAKGLDYVSEADAKDLVAAVLRQVRKNVKAARAEVWAAGEERGKTRLLQVACDGTPCRAGDDEPLYVDEKTPGVLAWAARTREAVWVNDVQSQRKNDYVVNLATEERLPAEFHNFRDYLHATLTVPTPFRGKLRGLIRVESTTAGLHFTKGDLEGLRSLEQSTAIVLWKMDAFKENLVHTEQAVKAFCRALDSSKPRMSPYRTGFIARPFEPEFERLSRKLEEIFRRREVRAKVYCPQQGGRLVVSEMIEQISSAHFGIVDLTGMNPNVLTEFGVLHGQNKGFLLFRSHKDTADLPFDLSGYHVHRYSFESDQLELHDPTGNGNTIDEVIGTFIDERLAVDPVFKAALPWRE